MAPSTPGFDKPVPRPDFPALEREMLRLWADKDIFARSLRGDIDASGEEKAFVFYDGPPFATGLPHYGHLLAGTLKDIVPRYWTMRGYRVERRFGWDTHGLPVEMEIEKKLGLNGPQEIRDYGIDNYNEQCRSIVLRYTEAWRSTVTRLGRWVDFDNDYKTLDPSFMESVWWVFAELWRKGLIYQGYKVMPYSWRLGTPLSNFEANMDYRKVQDPAVTVTLPAEDGSGDVFLAWTTTPWTLPSNMALCVGPDMDYVRARKAGEPTVYVLAKARAEAVLGEDHEVLEELKGTALVGRTYTPLFDSYTALAAEGAFRVVADGYVTADDGTGIVHQAPAFGEDDWRVCEREGIPLRDPVDAEGKFTAEVPLVEGMRVKEADAVLIKDLKERGRLLRHDTLDHEYPFCWRSGTPLIYKAISTWFVKVTDINKRMVALNEQTRWVPDYVGEKRFSNWLKDARDWAISRNRYWGTPLPIWQCTGCDHTEVFGSIETLSARAETPVTDLHKHHVDKLHFDCPECGGQMDRVPEVLDCWFESGAMPYAQNHYPFENKELVENNLPADFIAEGLDQTRGWFYTLLILSTALFDRPAFKNVIVNGLILAEDGQKMSKRLRNYPPPDDVVEKHGADALRAYLINSPVVRAEPMRFSERGVREVVRKVILPLWNASSFFLTYAAVDGWTPPATPSPVSERHILDRWVSSVLQSLVAEVNEEMEAYRLYNVIPGVLGFIDHLTNWYIRRGRRRFWRTDDAADKQHAFETLYEVLTLFSRLLAPILPFMAEVLFQQLEAGIRDGAEDSVHLERFPAAEPSLVDRELEAAMQVVRDTVTLGRNLREQHRLRVRQPLPKLDVALTDAEVPAALQDVLAGIIAEELNVKEVAFVADLGAHVVWSAKPDFKVLGRRLGKKMKVVAKAVMGLSSAEVKAIADGGTVTIADEVLGADDLLISQQSTGKGASASEGSIAIHLDTELTDALRREGLARELVSACQKVRKQSGLEVEDRIRLSVKTDDNALMEAISEHSGFITGETLAVELVELAGEHAEMSIDEVRFSVAVEKA
jgi:isoleucyl-tRNA synthetase